jgi:hypothetical protein
VVGRLSEYRSCGHCMRMKRCAAPCRALPSRAHAEREAVTNRQRKMKAARICKCRRGTLLERKLTPTDPHPPSKFEQAHMQRRLAPQSFVSGKPCTSLQQRSVDSMHSSSPNLPGKTSTRHRTSSHGGQRSQERRQPQGAPQRQPQHGAPCCSTTQNLKIWSKH